MPKFKLDIDLDGRRRSNAVRFQTRRNQSKAKEENRPPKWFRRIVKKCIRFSTQAQLGKAAAELARWKQGQKI